jgi:Zn-dependent protease
VLQPTSLVIAVFEFVLLIFSLSVHECAHAWMASRLGDQTARLQGRVTLNPMYHVDPIGTLLFPALIIFGPFIGFTFFSGLLVGWAKPTPVMTRNFRKIVRDDNLTTFAGPFSNLLLVALAFVGLAVVALAVPGGHDLVVGTFISVLGGRILDLATSSGAQAMAILFSLAILINLSLFFFNLLPIPPLDGSRIVRNLLPYNAVQVYDRIPIWVSYLLMIFAGGYIIMLFLRPSLLLVFNALNQIGGTSMPVQ